MELILYYIVQMSDLLIFFLILMFLIGLICFESMKNFNQERKRQVIFYGLFLKMTNLDIIRLAVILIKTFLVLYIMFVIEETRLWTCFIMIIILTVIYIICSPKKIIYELTCSSIQIAMLYLLYMINSYNIEIDNSFIILITRTFIIILTLMFTAYLFFREIDMITKERENKRLEKKEKIERKE